LRQIGRGGDHTELLNAGYPAVRFSVAVENYHHQHQDLRVENGVEYGDTVDKMDFPYLTRVVKLNVGGLAALASAPPPPAPKVEGSVSTDTTLKWQPVKGAEAYVVRWRRTDASQWEDSIRHNGDCRVMTHHGPMNIIGDCVAWLPSIRVDDYVFGVSSVRGEHESPVASAVPGGAFAPYTPPPPAQ
jgi:hypothetical protein